ncbi:MAG: ribosome silencing factor [Deltaproteobacteria bacterium]|nr:ribosome silencing factor [Deltaproteobacteria bacterium]MBW2308075.1 ribosome silencing factor [Deltaproteobacteria bacterium]
MDTTPLNIARLSAEAALDKKADAVAILEIKKLTSFADFFVICSGKSDRQVQSIAGNIELILKKQKILPLGIEGMREGRWVIMDYGDVVIHIFYAPVREFYDLDRLWGDAPRVDCAIGQ